MIRETEIRRRINVELDAESPLSDREWCFLESEKILHQLLVGDLYPAGVAEKVRQMRGVYISGPRQSRDRGGEVTPIRVQAISEIIAQHASKDEATLAFRDDVLGRRLLAKDEVADWIQKKAETETPPTVFLMVPLPPGEVVRVRQTKGGLAVVPMKPLEISEDWPAVGTDVDMLVFPVEGKPDRSMPVAINGSLERLRVLGETLSARYGWRVAEATSFVLTNVPPVNPTFSVRYERKDIPALSRIVLTIDPTFSPREVAQRYRQARRQYFSGRHRSMSEKHHTLVLFINSRPAGETYSESMSEWNRKYRKWKYKRETNFGRDVQVARRRLLGLDAIMVPDA